MCDCVVSKREKDPGASQMWESQTGCLGALTSHVHLLQVSGSHHGRKEKEAFPVGHVCARRPQ